jgi:hypothetical protein
MIDFRETMIIESSSTYENLASENVMLKKNNYILIGLIVTTIAITFYFTYKNEQEHRKILH